MNMPTEIVRPASGVDVAPAAPSSATPSRRRSWNLGLDRFSGLYVFAALVLSFGLWIPDLFLTTSNLRSIAGDQAVTAILAFGLIIRSQPAYSTCRSPESWGSRQWSRCMVRATVTTRR